MRSHSLIALLSLGALAPAPYQSSPDPDTDGDGLSDFQERHKYCTDPRKADSDGDGTPDGDWHERREFTYTVRAVMQVKAPYTKSAMNDDFQDVRILDETPECLEIEVVFYPLNTVARAITGDAGWREPAPAMKEFLAPGVTCNWDAGMREDLLRRLREDGIDVTKLTDKEVVEKVAPWAMKHAKFRPMFTTYAIHYPKGEPAVDPELQSKFDNGKGDASWSVEKQLRHEILGKDMYYNRSRGTCTSSAIYLTTVMRAVGIPARMIITVPVVNACDPRNRQLLERLTNHRVRHEIQRAVDRLGDSFAAHTYNEVWVGGRWRRLNYGRLGQNVLDRDFMGLMTHVHTFTDHSQAGLCAGWGNTARRENVVFRHNNPYQTLSLSDRFGEHCKLDNPPAKGDHRVLTIRKAYWFHSEERPRGIGPDWETAQDRSVGHLLVNVAECDGNQSDQYDRFYAGVDKRFELRARGRRAVRLRALRCWWAHGGDAGAEFYLRIPPTEYARMRRGARYRLHALNHKSGYRWQIDPKIRIERK